MGKRGPSPGTGGRPSKPLADKIAEGNPGKRPLKVMEFKDLPDMQGEEMPKPSEMLSATQKDGRVLQAKEIYEQTWIGLINADAFHTYLRKRWRGMRWLPPDGNIVKK